MRPSAVSLSKFGLLPASFAATASLNHNEHFSVYQSAASRNYQSYCFCWIFRFQNSRNLSLLAFLLLFQYFYFFFNFIISLFLFVIYLYLLCHHNIGSYQFIQLPIYLSATICIGQSINQYIIASDPWTGIGLVTSQNYDVSGDQFVVIIAQIRLKSNKSLSRYVSKWEGFQT